MSAPQIPINTLPSSSTASLLSLPSYHTTDKSSNQSHSNPTLLSFSSLSNTRGTESHSRAGCRERVHLTRRLLTGHCERLSSSGSGGSLRPAAAAAAAIAGRREREAARTRRSVYIGKREGSDGLLAGWLLRLFEVRLGAGGFHGKFQLRGDRVEKWRI